MNGLRLVTENDAGYSIYEDIHGIRWFSCRALCTGLIGEANVSYLLDHYKVQQQSGIFYGIKDYSHVDALVCNYMYDNFETYIRITGKNINRTLIEETYALQDYPAYDDEYVSYTEAVWQEAAWTTYIYDDLMLLLHPTLQQLIFREFCPDGDADAREWIREHIEEWYPDYADGFTYDHERAPACLNTATAFPDFESRLIELFREHFKAKHYAWRRQWHTLPGLKPEEGAYDYTA